MDLVPAIMPATKLSQIAVLKKPQKLKKINTKVYTIVTIYFTVFQK